METMKLVLYPLPKKVNCLEIIINGEHGDADFNTSDTYFVNEVHTPMDTVTEFVNQFNPISKSIYDNRSYGTPFPEGFKDYFTFRDVGIEIPYDKHYRCSHEYYADIRIEKIYWYDDKGERYVVEGWNIS